jgi:hypothetical protein
MVGSIHALDTPITFGLTFQSASYFPTGKWQIDHPLTRWFCAPVVVTFPAAAPPCRSFRRQTRQCAFSSERCITHLSTQTPNSATPLPSVQTIGAPGWVPAVGAVDTGGPCKALQQRAALSDCFISSYCLTGLMNKSWFGTGSMC